MKIYLVGMPGSGKTTLGKKISNQLQLRFVDLDKEIETYCGKTIPDIFIQNGEQYFREVESKLLHEFAALADSFIMATGGGAPCHFNGMEAINKSGLSIFLDVPVPELIKRVKAKNNRPLLNASEEERENTLIRLLETRLPCYKQANITVTRPNLERLLEAIHFRK